MNSKAAITYKKIVYIFSIVFYLAVGSVVVGLLAAGEFKQPELILPILIILGSVPHILIFSADRTRISYLVIGLVGLSFGILFLCTKDSDLYNVDEVCMTWGVIDICRGTTEIVNIAPHLKHKKVGDIVEVAISTGDIVVGILLCIHLQEGLTLHLIYLATAFFITVIKNVVELILTRKRNAESSNNH